MKKTIILIALVAGSLFASAQDSLKTDTNVHIFMNINQYRSLLTAIDQNIDSKTATREIIGFIQKFTQILADDPKKKKTK